MLTRILVGLVLAVLFIVVWLLGGVIQTVAFTIASLLCVYEMLHVLKKSGRRIFPVPFYILGAAAPILITYTDIKWFFLLAYVCTLITITARIFDKNGKTEDMLASLLVYAYPILTFTILTGVCTRGNIVTNRIAMFMTFAGALVGDTFAYFFGVLFGKKKLCEHISPKKTIVGSIGGMLGGICGGLITYLLQSPIAAMHAVEGSTAFTLFPLWQLLVLGFLLGIIGQIGDLFASCIKRWVGVKDYGTIFPGHGGMMDRIDSVMMCAPCVLLFLCL